MKIPTRSGTKAVKRATSCPEPCRRIGDHSEMKYKYQKKPLRPCEETKTAFSSNDQVRRAVTQDHIISIAFECTYQYTTKYPN